MVKPILDTQEIDETRKPRVSSKFYGIIGLLLGAGSAALITHQVETAKFNSRLVAQQGDFDARANLVLSEQEGQQVTLDSLVLFYEAKVADFKIDKNRLESEYNRLLTENQNSLKRLEIMEEFYRKYLNLYNECLRDNMALLQRKINYSKPDKTGF